MNPSMLQRSAWTVQVSRSSRQLSINLATPLSRHHHHILSPPTIAAPTSSFRSSRRASQAWSKSLSTSTAFRQGEAPNSASTKTADTATETSDLTAGFNDEPLVLDEGSRQVDWSRSFHGLSTEPFAKKVADVLLAPINSDDVEVKPDGIIFLPEIKYRRILNKAFGPGAWGLAPRGETIVTPKTVTREYALVAQGRLISVARGEQDYFSPEGIPTATEGCKSSALRRCCKDLGIASELWDPHFIRQFAKERIREVWVENATTKKKKKISMLAGGKVTYPWKIAGSMKD